MADEDPIQRYIDAGMSFVGMTRAKAEAFISELVRSGELERGDVQAWVDELLERSRQATDALLSAVRTEVTRQLDARGISNLDDLAKQVSAILNRTRQGCAPAKKTPAKKAPAKKATAGKKAAAKKAAAKKAPAKKAPATKKAPAKKAPATKKAAADGSGAAG